MTVKEYQVMEVAELIRKYPAGGINGFDRHADDLLSALDDARDTAIEEDGDERELKLAAITQAFKWVIKDAMREFAPFTVVPDPVEDDE